CICKQVNDRLCSPEMVFIGIHVSFWSAQPHGTASGSCQAIVVSLAGSQAVQQLALLPRERGQCRTAADGDGGGEVVVVVVVVPASAFGSGQTM
ncbi:MAG: hypothetical protein ACKPKO_51985, partial [Candidatus Fonsibacter sp.]